MATLFHWTLRTKLIVGGCFCQLLAMFAFVGTSVSHFERNAIAQIRSQATDLQQLLQASFELSLRQDDNSATAELAQKLTAAGTVSRILVLNKKGKTVADFNKEAGRPDEHIISSIKDVDWRKPTQVLELSLPINEQGTFVGSIQYGLDFTPKIIARSEAINSLQVLFAICFLLGLVFWFLISKQLTSRLRQLEFASRDVLESHYHLNLDGSQNDELGQVARAFKRMAEAVNQRVAQLETSEREKTMYWQQASKEHSRLSALLESMRFGVAFLDIDNSPLYTNTAYANIWNNQLADFSNFAGPTVLASLLDGREIRRTRETVTDKGTVIGSLWIFEDITAEHKAQRTIQYLADHDPLTGLLNRRSFSNVLEKYVANGLIQPFSLVTIDLDNFKVTNDSLGHMQGDQVLIQIAKRIQAYIGNKGAIARLGGDEFVVILDQITSREQEQWCAQLVASLRYKIDSSSGPHWNTCSIGIASYPKDARSIDELMAAADEALYSAKKAGRNTWRSYQPTQDHLRLRAVAAHWAQRIDTALVKDQFEIFLQGVFDAKSTNLRHYEALIRLPDLDNPGRYISPNEFIGHAEASGQILKIDRWMIRHCVAQLAKMSNFPDIAVNLSGITVADPSIVSYIEKTLEHYSVTGHRLHLELTESAAVTDIEQVRKTVESIQSLGCKVGLDDFGAGFASLAYLKRIPANYIKIDGMFINGLENDYENQVLLRAIVEIARKTNRETIAEWIEDERLLGIVRNFGVDLVQGYHFGKPASIQTLVRSQQATTNSQQSVPALALAQ